MAVAGVMPQVVTVVAASRRCQSDTMTDHSDPLLLNGASAAW